ncbi:alpha/beta fold hydrolase [Bernardetia sp. ABR2-2B]|uniref:alpha/beta hydrolase n=1 Tax=Bernardetia sp. ABR2-2B TaxID=3127472 RepID=UPI0030D4E3B3
MFFPQKLEQSYTFNFEKRYEEVIIPTNDHINLHGVLFHSKNVETSISEPKKLAFYLHGNVGAVSSWESIADVYTNLGYDLFILDYRGYGKSEGNIYSQEQFFSDVQTAYDFVRKEKSYDEKSIIVVGYSVGTASAAMLTSKNNPKALILQAPYFSITDMTKRRYPIIPTFLLKYKFNTAEFLAKTNVPTTIFHGTNDRVIPYESLGMIKEYVDKNNKSGNFYFITLENQRHGAIHRNPIFLEKIKELLLEKTPY